MAYIENNVDAKALSDNTANIGLANLGDVTLNFDGKGVANAISALAITRKPQLLGNMREAVADGLVRAYRKYRAEFDFLTDEQAFLLALNTPASPEQAANVLDVFGRAAKLLAECGAEPQPSSEAKAVKMLEGAKNSEEWAKDRWARLIAGELESPGSFSKHAMTMLDDMEREDAKLFEKYCSLCVHAPGGRPFFYQHLAIPEPGECDFTNEAMPLGELNRLESMGFIEHGSVTGYLYEEMVVAGKTFRLSKERKDADDLAFSEQLNCFGLELAAIVDVDAHPGLLDAVRNDLAERGYALEAISGTEAQERIQRDYDRERML